MDLVIGICVGVLGIYDINKNYKKAAKKKIEIGPKTDIIEDYFVSFSTTLMQRKILALQVKIERFSIIF